MIIIYENRIEKLIADIQSLIATHINDNLKGMSAIKSDYWIGRLFESEEFEKDMQMIIKKFK